jgi:predicted permease
VTMLWQDLRYGARMLRKRLGFTLIAILTLALGIGANTAIFSAVNGILLQSLPLKHPDRLVLFDDHASEGTSTGDPRAGVWQRYSFASYRYFAEHVHAFDDLAAFRTGEDRVSVTGEGTGSREAVLATAHLVSGNFFAALEAEAHLGRPLRPGDDAEAAPPVAVISHAYWQRHWGGEASVVGRSVYLGGLPVTIVGVMPESFFGLRVRRPVDFWLPLHLQPQIERTDSYLTSRDAYWLNLVGHLAPGGDLRRAQTEVDVAMQQFLRDQAGAGPTPEWKSAIERASIVLVPGARGISGLREFYGEPLRVLVVVTFFVLLIACANITHLLLSRAAERRGEISMRLALGASRWRLTRQLLTESVLLGAFGGGAGLLLALWGVGALKMLVSRTAPVDVGLSLPVLAFTSAVSLVAGLLFGLAPALRAGRIDLASGLRARGATGGEGARLRSGLAPALVVAQVALSLVLLAGAGLLVRSLVNLTHAELGFARDGVIVVDIDTRLAGLEPKELSGYYRRLLDRLGAVPGVRAVTVASFSPMNGTMSTSNISVEGFAPPPGEDMLVQVNRAGPRYTQVLGMSLIQGREFDARDGPGAPKVAIVNQAFARSLFHGGSPLGRRFGFGDNPAQAGTFEIVGVVGDAKFEGPREEPERMILLPLLQAQDQSGYMSDIEVRTGLDPAGVIPGLRQAVAEVDARVPIKGVTTLRAQVEESMDREQILTKLVGTFGLLALVLACVGLYGVVSQAVARRTCEVGIRMALGADRRDILLMVLGEVGWLVLVGVAIGVPGAVAASALIRTQLYGVAPADPLTLAGSALLLVSVAIAAGYLPARRAARIDPNVALRAE